MSWARRRVEKLIAQNKGTSTPSVYLVLTVLSQIEIQNVHDCFRNFKSVCSRTPAASRVTRKHFEQWMLKGAHLSDKEGRSLVLPVNISVSTRLNAQWNKWCSSTQSGRGKDVIFIKSDHKLGIVLRMWNYRRLWEGETPQKSLLPLQFHTKTAKMKLLLHQRRHLPAKWGSFSVRESKSNQGKLIYRLNKEFEFPFSANFQVLFLLHHI